MRDLSFHLLTFNCCYSWSINTAESPFILKNYYIPNMKKVCISLKLVGKKKNNFINLIHHRYNGIYYGIDLHILWILLQETKSTFSNSYFYTLKKILTACFPSIVTKGFLQHSSHEYNFLTWSPMLSACPPLTNWEMKRPQLNSTPPLTLIPSPSGCKRSSLTSFSFLQKWKILGCSAA